VIEDRDYDIVIVGSGAGGGTVAQEIAVLARSGLRILVVEQGPRLANAEFSGRELEMANALYEDGGGFLTADGTMTLAFGRAYGGSTVVYTGTSLIAPKRVIDRWRVPGLTHDDLEIRSRKYMVQNGVRELPPELINDNNRLFVEGCRKCGWNARQFPVNLNGCRGSGLCNLGCPNAAKQGTHRVQLPNAEANGVEVVTRAEALEISDRTLTVRVSAKQPNEKGYASEWEPGTYRIYAQLIVLAGGAVGTSALILRSPISRAIPHVGSHFTCHPALILVAEHPRAITNDVGHPKSYYLDRADTDRFVLETCMYFPFVTAKSLTGFGAAHSRFMRAFPRLQMILLLACDRVTAKNRITVNSAGKPVVHYTLKPETIEAMARGTRAATRIFFAAGAERVHAPLADPATIERRDADRADLLINARHFLPGRTSVSAAHLMGGCSMGQPHSAVTDSYGRVHGLPWLRVADSSLFPDSLEINPYLTIMALADRVAEGILTDVGALFATRDTGQGHRTGTRDKGHQNPRDTPVAPVTP
jgi:choline dehydrogenase-like flavoprotein